MKKTQTNTQKRIIGKPFEVGNPGGPGRPKLTSEQKIIKKEVKDWLKKYKERLAEALPKISPALIEQAEKGNIPAITEIHKVIGAYERGETPFTAIQININKDREKYK